MLEPRSETDIRQGQTKTAWNAGVVVSATLLSRILGYVRDMLIAWSFGTGIFADAFIVAFRIPNFVRRLAGEGALGMAFIPLYHVHAHEQGAQAALDLAAATFRRLALVLAVTVLLGIAFSPAIVRAIAPGFADATEKLLLAVALTRAMLPYVLMAGLVALSMAILNALGHFHTPALAPAILNAAMISSVLMGAWLTPEMEIRTAILAAGVVIGGILQLGIQLPALKHHGVRLGRRATLPSGLLSRFSRSALPVMLGGASYQLNVLLGTLLASFLAAGSVSYLFYADRLVQFPLGIFAISAVTVMMPDLSRQAAAGDVEDLKKSLYQSLSLVWFVTVPAMVGLIVLRQPIVAILFERGAFDSDSTHLTATALLWYSTGIWAYAALRVQLAVFYALQDVYRPLGAAALSVMVNLIAGILLMQTMGHGGIALAAALAAAVNVALLAIMLRQHIGPLGGRKLVMTAGRIFGCALLMGVAVDRSNEWFHTASGDGTLYQVAHLLGCIAVGVIFYLVAAFLCRSHELQVCYQMVFQGKKTP